MKDLHEGCELALMQGLDALEFLGISYGFRIKGLGFRV